MSNTVTQLEALKRLVGRTIVAIERSETGFSNVGFALGAFVLDDGTRIELTGSDDGQACIHRLSSFPVDLVQRRRPAGQEHRSSYRDSDCECHCARLPNGVEVLQAELPHLVSFF